VVVCSAIFYGYFLNRDKHDVDDIHQTANENFEFIIINSISIVICIIEVITIVVLYWRERGNNNDTGLYIVLCIAIGSHFIMDLVAIVLDAHSFDFLSDLAIAGLVLSNLSCCLSLKPLWTLMKSPKLIDLKST